MNCAEQAVPRLLWLDGQPVHRALVGGKGANLNTLAAFGAGVPPAFAVTTHAYRDLVCALGLPQRAREVADADLADLRATISATSLPTNLHDLVAHACGTCRDEEGTLWGPAVRPSATAEDASDFSFAALHDTILDVRDLVALKGAITQCWASLCSDRAVAAHRRAGRLADDQASMAVVVEQMVRSDVSFVVIAADSIGNHDQHLEVAAT